MGVWCQTLFHDKGWEEKVEDDDVNFQGLLYMSLMGHSEFDEATASEQVNLAVDTFCSLETATSSGLVGFFDTAVLLEQYPKATLHQPQNCFGISRLDQANLESAFVPSEAILTGRTIFLRRGTTRY